MSAPPPYSSQPQPGVVYTQPQQPVVYAQPGVVYAQPQQVVYQQQQPAVVYAQPVVVAQPATVIITGERPVPHIIHLILTILTGGCWLIIWVGDCLGCCTCLR